jgi:hypothetical protein
MDDNHLVMETMNLSEIAERDRCVAFVKDNLRTVFEVGRILTLMREKRLYRETHSTFADFCAEHFSISDRRARQLMVASEIGTTVPEIENEAQARELAKVEPADRNAVIARAKASCGGSLTAVGIREAAEQEALARGGLSREEQRRLHVLEQIIEKNLRKLACLEMSEADRLRHPDLYDMVVDAKAYVAAQEQLEAGQ